jgi:antitoxin VapB
MLAAPIQHLEQIDTAEANRLLVAWGHRMGACNRPFQTWAHALFLHGEPMALTVTATLIREKCCGLDRRDAHELARLCAAAPWVNRVMLRLWRECVHPAFGHPWAISYQDECLHTGNTYRLDGWLILGHSRSGTDQRSGAKGRKKTIWGWHGDAGARAAQKATPPAAEQEGR